MLVQADIELSIARQNRNTETVSDDERETWAVYADIHRGVIAYVDDALHICHHINPDFIGTTGLPEWVIETLFEHMTDQG